MEPFRKVWKSAGFSVFLRALNGNLLWDDLHEVVVSVHRGKPNAGINQRQQRMPKKQYGYYSQDMNG